MELRKVEVRLSKGHNIFEGGKMTSKRVPPTYVKGYFHCWEHYKEGKIKGVSAIVELEDGSVRQFEADEIKFLDKPQ